MVLEKEHIDNKLNNDILTPEEVAQYLRKSKSWVYKNWKLLGGRKLRGSLIFPRKEDLYERLFGKRQGLEVRLRDERRKTPIRLLQDKKGGKTRRGKKEGRARKSVDCARGNSESGATGDPTRRNQDPNRHGLLEIGQQKT